MRILYLGTSPFAVPSLEALAGSDHEVSLVVTAPARPRGRGLKVRQPPVAEAASRLGLELFQPERINAVCSVERLRACAPDLTVVVAYGRILSRHVLRVAKRATVNLHASLLPRWRGAAPIARAIQAGDRETGVSLQHVAFELDAGDVIDRERVPILPDETAGELEERLAAIAARVLLRNLDGIERGDAPREPQDPAQVTWARPLRKEEGRVPWHLPAERVHDHIRAMTPDPSAWTRLVRAQEAGPPRFGTRAQGETLQILAAAVGRIGPPEVLPGTVLRADGALEVQTGYGTLRILRLKRPSRRAMDAAEFLRGFRIQPGTRLA